MLQGKKILIGVSGSIAAYKIPLLVRLLKKAGASVQVIMTEAATEFVTPLTLATVSGNPVLTKLSIQGNWTNHVQLGREADLLLMAPLSCNTMAKMAQGICDQLLLAVYLSAICPVAIAPAMDEDMWLHPATRDNVKVLTGRGHHLIPVKHGELASGLIGEGRMAEPEELFQWIQQFFTSKALLSHKKVLITAGPTWEPIDPVRFIGNRSSGKMGISLAEECYRQGASVTLILGPVSLPVVSAGIQVISVETAAQMHQQAMLHFPEADICILAAAVADFTPLEVAEQKIKKEGQGLSLELKPTQDILFEMGHQKQPHQTIVGFALETTHEEYHALKKLSSKKADFIVLNSLRDAGAGFGTATNKITIFDSSGNATSFPLDTKEAIAADIIRTITRASI